MFLPHWLPKPCPTICSLPDQVDPEGRSKQEHTSKFTCTDGGGCYAISYAIRKGKSQASEKRRRNSVVTKTQATVLWLYAFKMFYNVIKFILQKCACTVPTHILRNQGCYEAKWVINSFVPIDPSASIPITPITVFHKLHPVAAPICLDLCCRCCKKKSESLNIFCAYKIIT